jgi:hypothetical protein
MSFFLTASNIKPNYNVTFSNEDRNIGRLDFNSDVMIFEGDAEESAQVFFDLLAEYFADRLKEERDNEREACAAFLDEYAKQYQSIAERQALEGNWNLSAITHSEKCLVEFLADKIRERGEKK